MPSIVEIAYLITSISTLVVAISGVIVSLRNSRKIEEVHVATNGKMEQLVTEVRKASFAKGVLSEKSKELPSDG